MQFVFGENGAFVEIAVVDHVTPERPRAAAPKPSQTRVPVPLEHGGELLRIAVKLPCNRDHVIEEPLGQGAAVLESVTVHGPTPPLFPQLAKGLEQVQPQRDLRRGHRTGAQPCGERSAQNRFPLSRPLDSVRQKIVQQVQVVPQDVKEMLLRATVSRTERGHSENRSILLDRQPFGSWNRRSRVNVQLPRPARADRVRPYPAQIDGRGDIAVLLAQGIPNSVDIKRVAGEIEDLAVLVSAHAAQASNDGLEPPGVGLVERFVEKQRQDLALLHLLCERDSRRQQQLGPGTVRQFVELPCFPAAQLNGYQAGRPFAVDQP